MFKGKVLNFVGRSREVLFEGVSEPITIGSRLLQTEPRAPPRSVSPSSTAAADVSSGDSSSSNDSSSSDDEAEETARTTRPQKFRPQKRRKNNRNGEADDSSSSDDESEQTARTTRPQQRRKTMSNGEVVVDAVVEPAEDDAILSRPACALGRYCLNRTKGTSASTGPPLVGGQHKCKCSVCKGSHIVHNLCTQAVGLEEGTFMCEKEAERLHEANGMMIGRFCEGEGKFDVCAKDDVLPDSQAPGPGNTTHDDNSEKVVKVNGVEWRFRERLVDTRAGRTHEAQDPLA